MFLIKFLQLMFEAFDMFLLALAECPLRRTILCSPSLLRNKLLVQGLCSSSHTKCMLGVGAFSGPLLDASLRFLLLSFSFNALDVSSTGILFDGCAG